MKTTRSLGLRALVKLLPREAIDPVAQVVAVFDIIGQCYETRHFRIEPGQQEFEIVLHSELYLLNKASSLNKLDFWEQLQVTHKIEDSVPELKQRTRWAQIKEVRNRLQDQTVYVEDLLDGMDTVDIAFRSMHLLFSHGLMLDGFGGVTETERYMCSAMLKPVVDQLNRVWLPLRTKIAKRRS